MVKFTLLFLILSIFSASVLADEVVCTQLHCVKRGDQCGYVNTRNNIIQTECESEDDGCYLENGTKSGDLYNTGTCQARPSSNQTCGGDSGLPCAAGYSCQYDGTTFPITTYRCQAIDRETNPGYPCSSNAECSWYSDLNVEEKTCSNGACKFTADGQACTSSNQCNRFTNSVCNISAINPTCYRPTYLQLGAVCDLQSSATLFCQGGHMDCIPNGVNITVGTCSYYYSQPEGGACSENAHCAKGYCSGRATTNVRYGQCVEFKKTPTLNKECIDNNYCSTGNGESCACDGGEEPKCRVSDVDEDYSKKYETARACVRSFETVGKCQYVNDDGKCELDACKKQICDYYKQAKKDVDQARDWGYFGVEPCLLRQACDASAIFASLSFSLLAVVFVLFF